jgi:AbrB family looped-hinge helix DNA binding protein
MKNMKYHTKRHHMFHRKSQCWGVTSLGERGQIVIPSEARKYLKLKSGEKLLFFSKGENFLGIVKADEVSNHLKKMLSKIEGNKK